MKAGRQTTLRDQAALSGVGVHSGLPVTLTLHPADADTGIRFVRTRRRRPPRARNPRRYATRSPPPNSPPCWATHPARWSPPPSTFWRRCRGLGVDNAMVEIDGPEAPIMDGSAAPFVAAIDQVGLETLDRAAPLHPGAQAGAGRDGRRLRRDPPISARLPDRSRDRVRPSADRPPIVRRRRASRTPSAASSRARAPSASCATWRSCGAPAMRSAPRSRTRWSSPTTASSIRKACASPTSSSATRCWTRSAIWRSRARRCSAPIARCAAATSSTMRCCRALMADASAWTWVEAETGPPGARPCRPGRRAWRPPAYGPDVS